MAARWYYQLMGEEIGPVSSSQLVALAQSGTILPDTAIRKGLDGRWINAGSSKILFESPQKASPASAFKHGEHPEPSSSNLTTDRSDTPDSHALKALTWTSVAVGAGTILILIVMIFRSVERSHQQKRDDDAPTTPIAHRDTTNDESEPTHFVSDESDGWTEFDLGDSHAPRGRTFFIPDPQPARPSDNLSPTDLYKKISPSVVRIEIHGSRDKITSLGTGFLVSRGGLVATNFHVIQGARKAIVRFNDDTTTPVLGVLAANPQHDLAVLKIDGSDYDPLSLSISIPEIGARVYAIGNPQGLQNTFSEGLISGQRTLDDVSFIQTTAAISSGSSGGPLLAENGEVVGITTLSHRRGQNLNLAIPTSALKEILDRAGQLMSLAQINAKYSSRGHIPSTIEDDPQKLASVWKLVRANKLADAARSLEEIPDNRRGNGFLMAKGHVYFLLGDVDTARSSFSQLTKNDPNNSDAHLKLAIVLGPSDYVKGIGWGVSYKVRSLCKRVIKIDPTNARAYHIQGTLDVPINEKIRHFRTALKFDPDHIGAQFNLGIALIWDNQYLAAIRQLDAMEELDMDGYVFIKGGSALGKSASELSTTESLQVIRNLAIAHAYRKFGKYDVARSVFKEVLAIEPDNPVALAGIAAAYEKQYDRQHTKARYWRKRARLEMKSTEESFARRVPYIVYFDIPR